MDFGKASSGNDKAFAYVLLRFTLGLNIFMHGLSCILAGPAVFAGTLDKMFQETVLAGWPVHAFGLALPWFEAGLGLLLLLGLWTRVALIGGALLIAVADVWGVVAPGLDHRRNPTDLCGHLCRAAGVASSWNRYSIDAMLARDTESG